MRALVTGANGFLGQWFTRELMRRGFHVRGVDDLSGTNKTVPDDLVEVVEIRDVVDFCREDSNQYDLALHFAAPVGGRIKIEQDPLFNARSLEIDSIFFRWAVHQVNTLVYPSSSAVYGRVLQNEPESMALREVDFSAAHAEWLAPDEMYGFTKLAGEVLAWKSADYGLNTLCIRPFSGYGEGQSFEYPVPSIAARFIRREDPLEVWGTGTQKRDFIHVEDIVRITLDRVNAGVKGYQRLNLGSGTATSFLEVIALFAAITGHRPNIKPLDDKPVGVATRFCQTNEMRKYGKPSVSLVEGLTRVLKDVEGRL